MADTGTDPEHAYWPAQFFLIAYAVTWTFWFADAYFSYRGGAEGLLGLLMFAGLCGPFVAALVLFRRTKSPALWRDYRDRLFSLRRIGLWTLPLILFLVPALVYAAIGISLLFGQSPGQFAFLLLPGLSAMSISSLIGLFLAPALEEAGWRGYGMDSLRSRSTLFVASLWFAVLWACWHIPLFFIKNFYHHGLLANWLYTANFFASVVAMAFLINWLYYRNNRSIVACFLFHLSANVALSFIPAEQFTRCIVTVLMFLAAALIVVADRKLFFGNGAPGPVS
jgi:membrane protease YdiL (CAAX protease family)